MKKVLWWATDKGPLDLGAALAESFGKIEIELVMPPTGFDDVKRLRALEYLWEQGPDISDPDRYSLMIVGGPASFLSGIDVTAANLFRLNNLERQIAVVADTACSEGRPGFMGVAPTIDLAIVYPNTLRNAMMAGYPNIVELSGYPPNISNKIAAFERLLSHAESPLEDKLEVVEPGNRRRPLGPDDRLIFYGAIKLGSMNNFHLDVLTQAGSTVYGNQFVSVFKGRRDEPRTDEELSHRRALMETAPYLEFKGKEHSELLDANMDELMAMVCRRNGIVCLTGGATDVFSLATLHIPALYLTSPSNIARNRQQGIRGSWPPGEAAALHSVFLPDDMVHAVDECVLGLKYLDSLEGQRIILQSQQTYFSRDAFPNDDTVAREIVEHVRVLMA